VDYAKLEQEMSHYLDLNHDGKIDQEDAKIAYQQVRASNITLSSPTW
jgi:hypothetical protein